MHSAVRFLVYVGLSLFCALPRSAFADATLAEVPSISADDVRIAFAERGYVVEPAVRYDWTSPPVASVRVRDSAADRVLMVLAYPDAATLGAVAQNGTTVLVQGFGPPVFQHNLAIVQSSELDLRRLATFELECDVGLAIGHSITDTATPSRVTVDPDFLAVLARVESATASNWPAGHLR